MTSKEEFEKAANDVKNLNTTLPDDELLELYSLYKQSSVGDCNTEKPGFLDFKGKAKWEAWNKMKGTKTEEAMKSYVDKAKTLIQLHGLKS